MSEKEQKFCALHSSEDAVVLCRFPDARIPFCHQCGREVIGMEVPRGLENGTTTCSDECEKSWNDEHPGYWTPIEETLPGGRYDGIWENSGLSLNG